MDDNRDDTEQKKRERGGGGGRVNRAVVNERTRGAGREKWRGIMKARRGLIARRGEEGDNERDGEKGAEMASLCVGKGTKGERGEERGLRER